MNICIKGIESDKIYTFKLRKDLHMDREHINSKLSLGLLILCFIETILIFSTNGQMNRRIVDLQQDITILESDLKDGLSSIRTDLDKNIAMQTKLYSDFSYHVEGGVGGQIHLTLNAALKSLPSNATATFLVSRDSKSAEPIKTVINNNSISGSITLPISESIDVSLLIADKTQTQTEYLGKITDISSYLSNHLYLTSDLSIKPKGDKLALTGGYVLLNSKPAQKIDSVHLELLRDGKMIHNFYFTEKPASQADAAKQSVFNLIFSDLMVDKTPGDYELNIIALEGNLEYTSKPKFFKIDTNGTLSETSASAKTSTFDVKLLTDEK